MVAVALWWQIVCIHSQSAVHIYQKILHQSTLLKIVPIAVKSEINCIAFTWDTASKFGACYKFLHLNERFVPNKGRNGCGMTHGGKFSGRAISYCMQVWTSEELMLTWRAFTIWVTCKQSSNDINQMLTIN